MNYDRKEYEPEDLIDKYTLQYCYVNPCLGRLMRRQLAWIEGQLSQPKSLQHMCQLVIRDEIRRWHYVNKYTSLC